MVLHQCGPDEWRVLVQDPRLATLEDGTPAPDGTPGDELCYPAVFGDASEIEHPGEGDR